MEEEQEFCLPVVTIKKPEFGYMFIEEIREFRGFKRHAVINKKMSLSVPAITSLEREFLEKANIVTNRIRSQQSFFSEEESRALLHRSILNFDSNNLKILGPRLLYQLDQKITELNGWSELQNEVKAKSPFYFLEPIEFEDFFIIRSLDKRYKKGNNY